MTGIKVPTVKQIARQRFFKLVAQYNEAQKHLDTEEGQRAFVLLSLQVHAAKASVPKYLWRLVKLQKQGGE